MDLGSPLRRAAACRFLSLPEPVLARLVGPPIRSPEGATLDVQIQALLWLARLTHAPDVYDPDVAKARRRFEREAQLLTLAVGKRVASFDRTLHGAAGPVHVRIYTPSERSQTDRPALVWLHGGGFVLGSVESDDGLCRALALQSGALVLSVDYRLAPEHPFPAGLEDSVAIVRWVLECGDVLGINPNAVAIGGASAGANLAAVTALRLRHAPRRPVLQLLLYPSADATLSQPSHRHFADGFLLTEKSIQWFIGHYLRDARLVTDPDVSPLFAQDLSALPPAIVVTAGFDPLRDEGRAYATRMRAAGVPVESIDSDGAVHGFLSVACAVRESRRVLTLAAQSVRRALSKAATLPARS